MLYHYEKPSSRIIIIVTHSLDPWPFRLYNNLSCISKGSQPPPLNMRPLPPPFHPAIFRPHFIFNLTFPLDPDMLINLYKGGGEVIMLDLRWWNDAGENARKKNSVNKHKETYHCLFARTSALTFSLKGWVSRELHTDFETWWSTEKGRSEFSFHPEATIILTDKFEGLLNFPKYESNIIVTECPLSFPLVMQRLPPILENKTRHFCFRIFNWSGVGCLAEVCVFVCVCGLYFLEVC